MNLAEKLIYLRKKQGLTQLELAEKLNVSRQAVSRWEVGLAVPSTDNLKILGDLYGVSVDYLLNDKSEHMIEKSEEGNAPTFEKPKKAGIDRKHTIVYLVMAVIIVILMIVIIAMRIPKQDDEIIVPMENMTIEENSGNDYSTIIFPIN